MLGDILAINRNISVGGLNAEIELRVSDSNIDNLDTAGALFHILETVNPYVINNTVSLGVGDKKTLRSNLKALASFKDDSSINLKNLLDINVDLESLTIIYAFPIKMIELSFYNFRYKM